MLNLPLLVREFVKTENYILYHLTNKKINNKGDDETLERVENKMAAVNCYKLIHGPQFSVPVHLSQRVCVEYAPLTACILIPYTYNYFAWNKLVSTFCNGFN